MSCSPRAWLELNGLTSVTKTVAPPSSSASGMPNQDSKTPKSSSKPARPCARPTGYLALVESQLKRETDRPGAGHPPGGSATTKPGTRPMRDPVLARWNEAPIAQIASAWQRKSRNATRQPRWTRPRRRRSREREEAGAGLGRLAVDTDAAIRNLVGNEVGSTR